MSVRWHHCIDHADTKQKPLTGPDCLLGVVPQPTDSRLSETSCRDDARTKSQRKKSQPLVLDVGVQTFLIYTCMHGSVPWFMYSFCIHTYHHHAQLLDAAYTIMLFWIILLLTETLILTIWCQSGVCIYL